MQYFHLLICKSECIILIQSTIITAKIPIMLLLLSKYCPSKVFLNLLSNVLANLG